jgi:hypothetical protein
MWRMDTPHGGAPRLSRRSLLRLAALAPLGAGCATVGAGPSAGPAPAAVVAKPPAPDPLAALRTFPLAEDAEPALTFRALSTPKKGAP